eukprot:SAG31_NODE_15235_length_764_cov_1.087218_2_plen_186_part_00
MGLPQEILIPDFSPEKIATIAEEFAYKEKGCTFENGLWDTLKNHIRERYEDLSSAGNGRLARKLVENADRWREERVFGAALTASQSQGVREAEGDDDPRCFIASDFNMNAKLVEEQLKLEVEKDILDLIGMEVSSSEQTCSSSKSSRAFTLTYETASQFLRRRRPSSSKLEQKCVTLKRLVIAQH